MGVLPTPAPAAACTETSTAGEACPDIVDDSPHIVEACEPKELLLEEDEENCNDRGVDWGDERLGGSSEDDEDEEDDGGVDRDDAAEKASVHDAEDADDADADDADAGSEGRASDAEGGGASDVESVPASLADVGDAPIQELAQSEDGEA